MAVVRSVLVAVGVGAVLAGTVHPAAAAPAAYRVVDLGTLPGGTYSIANAVNDAGLVVGESDGRAVLWRDGRIVDLGAASYSSATDVNAHGVVVGSTGDRAFRWQRGRLTELAPLPGDQFSSATAVNDRGEVLGASSGDGYRAVLWRPDGSMVDLTARTGLSRLTDLDDAGNYVGSQLPDGMNDVPVLWSKGRVTVLSRTSGIASAINDHGGVAGFYVVGAGQSFTWRNGRLTDIPLLPDMPPASMMQAQAINNAGLVVGAGAYDGFAWDGDRLTVLPHLYGHGVIATGVNDRGAIVGSVGTTPSNLDPHAVLLLPRR